jgi:hypothetical protein
MNLETYCPICNDHTMEKLEEGRYKCSRCGLGRIGNPEKNLIVFYDRALPSPAMDRLYHKMKPKFEFDGQDDYCKEG